MTADVVMDISRDVIWTVVKVAAPLLIISLVVGLIISVFQTITSIQEQTLTFVPKFIAIMIVLIIGGGWMMKSVSELFISIMNQIPTIIK